MIDTPYPSFTIHQDPKKGSLGYLGELSLHSKHNPGEEIRQQLKLYRNNKKPIIIIGLGLGKHIPKILEIGKDRSMIFLEPHPEIWDWLSKHESSLLSPFTRAKIYHVTPGNTDFDVFARTLIPGDKEPVPGLIVLPAYRQQFPDLVQSFETRIKILEDRKAINLATLKRFGKLWIRNTIRNFPLYSRVRPVQEAFGKFANYPALLLAAGPSLDSILDKLDFLREYFLLVAVDTAVKPCLKRGIEPDFIIMVDPQYWNTRHLDRLFPESSIFVTESSVNPRSLHHIKNPPLLTGSIFPLGEFMEEGAFERLGAGGSVATTGWDFARNLGCKNIFCAGLDLGFPGMKTHVSGSLSEEMSHFTSTRYKTVESLGYRFLLSGSISWVKDYESLPLLSDKRMDVYSAWFEIQVTKAIQSGIHSFSFSPRSRHIAGFQLSEIQTVVQKFKLEPIRLELDGILQQFREPVGTPSTIIEQQKKMLINEAQTLLALSETAIIEISHYFHQSTDTQGLIQKLDTIDSEILGQTSRRVLGFLIEDVLQEIQNLGEPETLEVSLHRSQNLYQAFTESAKWLLNEILAEQD